MVEELLSRLEKSPVERLRWRVLRYFSVLPGSKAAKKLSDEDVLFCGAHMVLDSRRHPAAGKNKAEASFNGAFDSERFSELGGEL